MESNPYEDEWWHETREAAQKALDAANAVWNLDHPEPMPNGAVRAVKFDDGNIDELDVDDPDCWVVMDETGEWMVGNLDPVWCLVG